MTSPGEPVPIKLRWLIERNISLVGAPLYWTFSDRHGGGWTTLAMQAAPFLTRESAQAVVDGWYVKPILLSIVEHAFG